jgi:hypothetical protein
MRTLILLVALLGCIIIPSDHRLISTGDDDDYFSVASSIAFGKFPSFSDEFHAGQKMPFASVGSGVLASPFVAAFSVIDWINDAPITQRRNKENRYWSWSLFGFHFSVYFYFLCGVSLTYVTCKMWSTELGARLATIAIVVGGGGILIYVFRRPVMSHVFEFLAVSLGVYLISRSLKGRNFSLHPELIGLCAAFIFLTRYNNAFLAAALVCVFIFIKWKSGKQLDAKLIARTAAASFMPVFIFRILPVIANGYSEYDQAYGGGLTRIIPAIDPLFYWNRTGEILFGPDMGLLYTAPVLILSLIGLYRKKHFLPNELLVLTAFAAINFYFAIIWKSFGSYYGYRYVAFTASSLLCVYLALLTDDILTRIGKIKTILLYSALMYLPLMSMLAFERSGKYSFGLITNPYGVDTYSQPTYHAQLLADLIQAPLFPLIHAVTAGWEPLIKGALSPQQAVQRILLYFLPPLAFWVGYELTRLKHRRSNRLIQSH